MSNRRSDRSRAGNLLNAQLRDEVFKRILPLGVTGVRKSALVKKFVDGNPLDEENRRPLNRLTEALATLVNQKSLRYVRTPYAPEVTYFPVVQG